MHSARWAEVTLTLKLEEGHLKHFRGPLVVRGQLLVFWETQN